MSDLTTFVQAELPKRPFTENDGQVGQIPVRSGLGPRQLDWKWIEDIVPASSGQPQLGSYTFTESLVWTVVHNKNTLKISPSCFDANHQMFYAKVVVIDVNSFEVHLTEASAGSVNVVFM